MEGRYVVAIVVLSVLISTVFLSGVLAESGDVRGGTIPLQGTEIFSSDKVVSDLSVYGSKAAWTVWNGDGGWNPDVYGYDGGVKVLASSGNMERKPSVGDFIVWVEYLNDSTRINSDRGLIYEGQDGPDCPRIDGSTVVFSVNGGIKVYRGSVKMIASTPSNTYCPDVSGDLVVYGPKIYSFKNSTEWNFSFDSRAESRISGDWIITVGRDNFGRSVYVEIWNPKWHYEKRVWEMDVGEYYGLDSLDIDGNFVVWSYGGTAYLFNLVTMQLSTYYSSLGSIGEIAVGGGKLLWSVYDDYGKYHIVMGDAPSTPEYVDVTLTSKVSGGPDEGAFHNLLIIDSAGNRFGYDSSFKHYEEISGALELKYGDVMKFRVVGNTEGLKYQVIGMSNVKYDLVIEKHAATRGSDLMSVVKATGISISNGEVQQYVVDWSKLTSGMDGAVQISIDTNGDGTFETTVSTSSGDINQETIDSGGSPYLSFSLGGIMCFAIIGVIAIVLILLVVLLLRRKK